MSKVNKLEVLYIEDNAGDQVLVQELIEQLTTPVHLSIASDGPLALDFLNQVGEYAEAPRPQLILLDLNLPRMDGLDVLKAIKLIPELLKIPVLVFSSSSLESDIDKSRKLNASGYYMKPSNLIDFEALIKRIDDDWLQKLAG